MKIYGRVIMVSAKQYANDAIRKNTESISHAEVEYQTGVVPEPGTWEFIPAHEATWTDLDTGEERTTWVRDQWRYLVEVAVTDDWEERR